MHPAPLPTRRLSLNRTPHPQELKKLRSELMEKSKNVVDKRRLLEEDEKLKRAEQDKLAAITALEQRSRTLMQEKKEKKKLEERIKHLQVVSTLARCHIPDVSHNRQPLSGPTGHGRERRPRRHAPVAPGGAFQGSDPAPRKHTPQPALQLGHRRVQSTSG